MTMDHDRLCTEIIAQTEALVVGVEGADLRLPVPSCPDWTLGMLLRHIGGGHRWAEETVRTRATGFLPDDQLRKLTGDDTSAAPTAWLRAGAVALADTLRVAGPDTTVWTPLELAGRTSFWSRRFAHETLIHRADATLATGTLFAVAEPVAVDAVDEWLELDVLPAHFEYKPQKRELLGPGRTIALVATDAPSSWTVDLTGDEVLAWRPGVDGSAAVTLRAAVSDLLLTIYRRRPVDRPGIEIEGDRGLFDFWLGHVGFA
jgi:uncharacterized protein (TIGR03083 family)